MSKYRSLSLLSIFNGSFSTLGKMGCSQHDKGNALLLLRGPETLTLKRLVSNRNPAKAKTKRTKGKSQT